MDKYTVDLDKVLNDFEYSEYSLESAKVNRNIQDENPNTSFNTNHCSRNDISVKHSINNVFHSLNEYLSSDINPKLIENPQKKFKDIDIPNESETSNSCAKPTPPKMLPQTTDTAYNLLVDPVFNNASEDKQNDSNEDKIKGTSHNSLVNKTDTYSDTCAINSKQEIHENKHVPISSNISIPTENVLDNKLLDEMPEEKSSINLQNLIQDEAEIQIVTKVSNEISQEILDNSGCKGVCNDVTIYQNTDKYFENLMDDEKKEENAFIDNSEIRSEIHENSIPEDSVLLNNQLDTDWNEKYLEDNKKEIKTDSITDQQSIENKEIDMWQVKKDLNEETDLKIEKIGFNNDVELDEENIEQYFQELEEELGIQIQEENNEIQEKSSIQNTDLKILQENNPSLIEIIHESDNDSSMERSFKEINVIESEEKEITVKTLSIHSEEVGQLKQEPELTSNDSSTHIPTETKLLTTFNETDSVKEDIISTVTHLESLSTMIESESLSTMMEPESLSTMIEPESLPTMMEPESLPTMMEPESLPTMMEPESLPTMMEPESLPAMMEPESLSSKSEEQINCSDKIKTDLNEEVHIPFDSNPVEQTLEDEQGKNSRPHILPLSEDVTEPIRKINLIGEPGSTPYNNLYSTKEFEKTITESSGDHNTVRAISPTYSDVSTDSVSSSSSDDTGEYNDAVSEVPDKKEEKTDMNMMQNNMVYPVETPRSDITMDKDFKNNLKTGNLRTEDIPNTSCSPPNENEVSQLDRQDIEGACAMVIETNNSDIQTNIEKNNEQTSSNNAGIDWLGKQAPLWIPDSVAMSCLHCDMKFTVIKRRHHCRACGLVLCSKCCNLKFRLEYLNAEARVCTKCFEILDKGMNSNSAGEVSQELSSPSRNSNVTQDNLGQPNPNNPHEYCSTIPPTQQVDPGAVAVPSVMVPVGVLKRKGSNKGRSNKSVMFCDGIRPGSDLTNLDTDFNYSENQKSEKLKKSPDKSARSGRNLDMLDTETKSFIPNDERSLPPTVTIFKTDIKYSPCANNSSVVEVLKNESLTFALQSNVFVHVKIINMDCCISRIAWCFSTEGLINVGQDEIVILLEFKEKESLVPKEIFMHLNFVYLEAVKGSSVKELGMSLHPNSPFLDSKNHFGFIYIRPTFQCLQNIIIPKEPYLIGILIHRWETPWAKLFPLRLVLRLGAEYKYYPSPIISTRDRDSVFVEIGHTIINLLADFRNFSYTLPQIRGLMIHMEDKNTTVTIPKNRYDQVLKSLSNSSDHILAFAGNFSSVADSHLVCIQDTQSASNDYSTHAINICNQPRKVTGASFIVFNGALKSTSGLTAKSNIVEDGLMIQILPEHMLQVRDALKSKKNHTIRCGCINEESDETVTIIWGEPDTSFNVGVLSPIDNKVLTGIPSIRVHNGKDYTCNSGNRLIRWTEVFISQGGEESSKNQDPIDISKISENISRATCQALVKYLDLLVSNSFYKIGLRTHIHVENVSYSAGSNNVILPPIYMKSLDNELIPVLHRIASNNITEQPIILELIFRILNI
ncbi:zinc finger FYVE domain-containing protein 9 [Harmonia axyridis]|uniref:zinc finger FYVE domain-containing protein 9 n=1 Tax=Harmonia axyridis TaxID=115357 RepID=UPI001E277E59|nr:zinc finger FYVE domain-containing protein 9 [Harmonia axyridis]